ncbi:three prime repair exonuclease 2-like [Cydia pomonella]|uniref:three prime repair exonuclease 2-like n=1 Tax=Cydia pomonella TaxID=82600 RepID=UPI002ADE878C|nr:three prime repair exonuclease 2-like [Cydia pomonella]
MASNGTYVFLDLGTVNDPKDKNVKYITELSMAAVRRDNLIDSGQFYEFSDEDCDLIGHQNTPPVPRVQLKLTLCFNPGLEELLNGGFKIAELKPEKYFDDCFDVIDNFLGILTEPVYLVAHNGFNFDFPILKRHLKGKTFSKDVMCADTYYGFYDILEKQSVDIEVAIENTTVQLANSNLDDSPEGSKKRLDDLRQANADRVKKNNGYPWAKKENRPAKSYKLTNIYERVLKCKPEDAHKGDIDCQLMIRIAVKLAKEFVEWVEKNHSSFAEHVEPTSEEKEILEKDKATAEVGNSGSHKS